MGRSPADFFKLAGEHRAVSFEKQLGVGVGHARVAALHGGGLRGRDAPLTYLSSHPPPDLTSLRREGM